jgi:endonuclease YncB( thermonuclease family)
MYCSLRDYRPENSRKIAVLLASTAAAICLQGQPALAATISGIPKVVDGDTLEFGDQRVRLYGIDAPESKQQCTNRSGKEYACGAWDILCYLYFQNSSND